MRVGLILRHLDEEFQITVFRGVRARAMARGVDLVCLQNEPFPAESPDPSSLALVPATRCDGYLILTSVMTDLLLSSPQSLAPWLNAGPVVSVGVRLPQVPSVVIRSRRSLTRVVEHLILDHGYRRFLFVGGSPHHAESRTREATVRQTFRSFSSWKPGLSLEVEHGNFTSYSAQQILRARLADEPFDAIIAANDSMAIGVLKVLNLEADSRWAWCAVTGFDDTPRSAVFDPPLTSVHQPLEPLGIRALDTLIDSIEGRRVPLLRTIDSWPVIRQSCGCPGPVVRQDETREGSWGPSQRQAAEAEHWLRLSNTLAGDLGTVQSRQEVWALLDAYLGTLGLANLSLLEPLTGADHSPQGTRLMYHRQNGTRAEFPEPGPIMDLNRLLDSLPRPEGGAWDSTVVPVRSGGEWTALAVYSAPLDVHPYMGIILPHVAHSLRRLQELAEQKERNLLLEQMVLARTRELVEANQELLQQQKGLQTILRTLPLPLALFADGIIVYSNPAFETTVGAQPVLRPIETYLSLPTPCDGVELVLQGKGGPIPVLTYCAPIEFEHRQATLVALVDLSRQRALESEVLQISEWERRRFGLELHDDICQRLAGIVMFLRGFRDRSSAPGSVLTEVGTLVDETLRLTRQYSHASFPIDLDRGGLASALGVLSEAVASRTGRSCRFEVEGPPLDRVSSRDLHVYRIVQEALHNAVKHAKARNVEVSMQVSSETLLVRIRDDGRGWDGSEPPEGGLGLRSMNYRAAQIGAQLAWVNRPGQGVDVVLTVPRGFSGIAPGTDLI